MSNQFDSTRDGLPKADSLLDKVAKKLKGQLDETATLNDVHDVLTRIENRIPEPPPETEIRFEDFEKPLQTGVRVFPREGYPAGTLTVSGLSYSAYPVFTSFAVRGKILRLRRVNDISGTPLFGDYSDIYVRFPSRNVYAMRAGETIYTEGFESVELARGAYAYDLVFDVYSDLSHAPHYPTTSFRDSNDVSRMALVDSSGYQYIVGSVSVTGTPTVSISGTPTVTDAILSGTFVVKSYDWTTNVTGQAIWTPASGKKFVLCDLVITASAACTVTLFDGSTDSATYRIFKAALAANGGAVVNYRKPYASAAADNVLKLTTSATGGFVTVSGYEI